MSKDRGKASIVLLIGTSSAGKSTIVKELKSQDKLNPHPLDWQEDGLDLELGRYDDLYQDRLNIIVGDLESLEIFEQLRQNPFLKEGRIIGTIASGKLAIEGASLSLLDENLDDEKVRNFISLSEADKITFDEKTIKSLHDLVQKHHDQFIKVNKRPHRDKMMENIYERAIQNSKKGLPSILDLIPFESYDVIAGFNQYCLDRNFSCPLIIALAHCDVSTIVEHMDKRNTSGDPREKRDAFFPFDEQYAVIYRVTNSDDPRAIGTLTMQDVLNAANKYGYDANRGNVLLLENSKDAQGFVKKLGMAEDHPLDKPVKVAAKIPHDLVLQTGQKNNVNSKDELEDKDQIGSDVTSEIAKRLNSLAAMESFVPKVPHPTATIIKESPHWINLVKEGEEKDKPQGQEGDGR
ncbi:MAG: hypothetical protein K0R25_1095 [Rickettsiaceae bacterium]|jgi:septin family protein|nr:hypothetical protein [Rickettsiaceae bacterium]